MPLFSRGMYLLLCFSAVYLTCQWIGSDVRNGNCSWGSHIQCFYPRLYGESNKLLTATSRLLSNKVLKSIPFCYFSKTVHNVRCIMFIELDPKMALCFALLTLGLSLKSLVHRYLKCSNLVDLSISSRMLLAPLV
jgi:hypothetical protein